MGLVKSQIVVGFISSCVSNRQSDWFTGKPYRKQPFFSWDNRWFPVQMVPTKPTKPIHEVSKHPSYPSAKTGTFTFQIQDGGNGASRSREVFLATPLWIFTRGIPVNLWPRYTLMILNDHVYGWYIYIYIIYYIYIILYYILYIIYCILYIVYYILYIIYYILYLISYILYIIYYILYIIYYISYIIYYISYIIYYILYIIYYILYNIYYILYIIYYIYKWNMYVCITKLIWTHGVRYPQFAIKKHYRICQLMVLR